MFVDVAVCLPLARRFVYETDVPVLPHSRVRVPFKNNEVDAFVLETHSRAPQGFEPRRVLEVLDPEPLIDPGVFRLCEWISGYYLAPLGEVLRSALPPKISRRHVERAAVRKKESIAAHPDGPLPELTPDQARALKVVNGVRGFQALLLHGVTGSGKTEIYLRATAQALERGKSVLVLVPEIGLTPQLTERFHGRFGSGVAVLHSALTARQRIDEWLRIRRGDVPILIGTRSAVFAPLQDLGLVIVDEEHETTYKQEEMPRYNGRDTAVMRAKLAGAAILLGSATPSMESYRNAIEGKYTHLTLPKRVEDRPLPAVAIVNMREEHVTEGKQVMLSARIIEALRERLERGEQAMLLLNRRGYAMFLLCRHCGHTYTCSNCSVSLTYHRRIHKLLCHYCGTARRPPERCTECQSEHIFYVGQGTERLEEELKSMFPDARVDRLDRDTMRKIGDFERVLGAFRSGQLDVLVGTQMIAKGHDFPGVTLVGVLAADAALSMPDFRAAERTYQLLTQVAGRSGRGDRPGEVIIQSYFPDHYTFQLAVSQRFEEFYARESGFRRSMFYPPFTALAGIMTADRDNARAARVARQVSEFIDERRVPGVRVLGPAPAPLEKLKRVHRHQLLIKSVKRAALHSILKDLQAHLEETKLGSTRVMIDVDPVSLM